MKIKATFGEAFPKFQCLNLSYLITSLNYSLIRNLTTFFSLLLLLNPFQSTVSAKLILPLRNSVSISQSLMLIFK